MKKLYLALTACCMLWTLTMNAQCPPPGFPFPGDNCSVAPTICNDLNGVTFCNTLSPNNVPATFPGCGGGAVLNNDEWLSFIAGSTQMTFNITPSNCQGTNGQFGMQGAILDACNGTALATQCACTTAPFSLGSSAFEIGQVYYLVLDGCSGDICDYTLVLAAGTNLFGPPADPPPPQGATNTCPGSLETYFVDPVFGASDYIWTITPPLGTFVGGTNTNLVSVQWSLPGTADICLQVFNQCATNNTVSCTTVTIANIPPSTEEHDLCIGGCVTCAGQQFCTPGVFPVTITLPNGCDSVVNCVINPLVITPENPPPVTMCGPATYTHCGETFNQTGIYFVNCETPEGCDSTITLDLAIFNPQVNIAPPDTLGCDSTGTNTLTLDASNSSFNPAPNTTITFQWTGPGIVGPDDEITAEVNAGGTYCFTLTLERDGVACSDQQCVDVIAGAGIPDAPTLTGADASCLDSVEVYIVTSPQGAAPTGYTFTTRFGEPITVVGANQDTVEVTWDTIAVSEICVTADNDCGSSTPTCLEVTVSGPPAQPQPAGNLMVCESALETYIVGNPDSAATYAWTAPPGATIIGIGDTVTINFSGVVPGNGQVCVSSTTDCGTRDSCLAIFIEDIPAAPSFDNPVTELCSDGVQQYCVVPVSNATSYTWYLPNDTLSGIECMDMDWSGLSGGQICVTADNDCGASPQTCIDVDILEAPTAVLAGSGAVCENSTDMVDLTITLTGTGPWTVDYTLDGTPQTPLNINTSPFTLTTGTPGTYELTAVSDATICPGTASGTATVVQNPAPTALLTGGGSICQGSGQTVDLTVDLTGTGPWTVQWSIDGNPQAPFTATASPHVLSISQAQAGLISLGQLSDANGCDGTGSGTALVEVNSPPTVGNISETCNGTNTGYTVSFTISGGDPATYSVTPFDGSFDVTGTVFTSNEIPSGNGYSFQVDDGNGCGPVLVERAVFSCNCTSTVGSMDATPLEECGDGPVTATYDPTGQNFDANDALMFVLHEGSGTSIVNPLATNTTDPTFGFDPGTMTYGTTYYISAVVGNDLGGGQVDLTDFCLDVAQGTPVTFFEIPSATLSGTPAVCEGDDATLTVDFTGPGPWNLTYDDGLGNQQTVNGITNNPFSLVVTPTGSTTYTLVDMSNADCPGTVGGSADVTVHTGVSVSNVQTACNNTATGYVLSFEISGGDPATYTVSGVTGTLSPTPPFVFTSDEIPAGTGYSVTVDDANGCDPQTLSEPTVDCNCITAAGSFDPAALDECGDGPVTATYDPSGQNLDGNDVLVFVLHTQGTPALGTVLQSNPTEPTFSFDPGTMTYGTTYFISALVGSDDGSGNPDPNDPCRSVALGPPVTFFEVPTGTLSGDAALCAGESTQLSIALTGDAPWSVTINGTLIDNINTTPLLYTVTPTATTTYTLEAVGDENCPGLPAGTATVTVNEAPQVTLLGEDCNATATGYTVSFQISGGDPASYSVNPPNGSFDVTGTVFTSNEIPSGSGYSFSIDDANGCGPVTLSSGPVTCNCISQVGTLSASSQDVCGSDAFTATYDDQGQALDPNDVLCFILYETDPNFPIARSDQPSFSFIPGVMAFETTYLVSAVVGNDNGSGCVSVTDPCRSISPPVPVVFHAEPTAQLQGDADVCEGETTDLIVTLTGIGPWNFQYQDAGGNVFSEVITSSPHTLTVLPFSGTVYSPLSVSDANCDGTVSGQALVNVMRPPDAVNVVPLCDPTGEFYTVSFEIIGGDPASYLVSGGTGTLNGNLFTSDPIPNGTPYSFDVDDANGCGPTNVSGVNLCPCQTDAGTMTGLPIDICEDEIATTDPAQNPSLDGNDVLIYVLHDRADDVLGLVLATNSQPSFSFDINIMGYDQTYWISAVVGNDDGSGGVDFLDPCLSVAPGVPVVFRRLPQVSMSAGGDVCEGQPAELIFTLSGGGPYEIVVNDGSQDLTISANTDNHTETLNLSTTTTFTLVSVTNPNTGCSSPATGSVTIQVNPPVSAGTVVRDFELCEGGTDVLDLDDALQGADPGGQWFDAAGNPVGNTFNTAGQAAGTYTFTYRVSGTPPCPDDEATVTVTLNPLPVADAGADAELTCDVLQVTLGGNSSPGMTYSWSGGLDPVANPTTDQPGTYTLTVTDPQTGCSATDEVTVSQSVETPEPEFEVQQVSCFGEANGAIIVTNVNNGAPPYSYALNGGTFVTDPQFLNLAAGTYTITVRDSKGCEVSQEFTLVEPPELTVEIVVNYTNSEEFVELGGSVDVQVITSIPFSQLDNVIWSPDSLSFGPEFTLTPSQPLTLGITVQEGSCQASDEVNIVVRKTRPVFIPNAFSPDGDGINDRLTVFGGPSVLRVRRFMVFDRWGEPLYELRDFEPNDPSIGWDGTYRGQDMDQGVYVFFAEVEFIDGEIELFKGDVVLLR